MKIVKYRIQNYRAIIDTEIKLNYSINPIIGVNESGKTTVLQAILAFDKTRDRYNAGMHLNFQNKYTTIDTIDSSITAYIQLNKEECKELIEETGLKTITSSTTFILIRELSASHRTYRLLNDEVSSIKKGKIAKFISERLPFILYFDDFTDRVPDDITFADDFNTTGVFGKYRTGDWQQTISEIFKRAQTEGTGGKQDPLISFLTLKQQDRKDDVLSDIQDVLNKEIINEWKKIKRSGLNQFADDSENLSIDLKNEGNTFRFKVRDTSNQDKKRTFNVSERSKGFQWFFNYMIKLKFNSRYKKNKENSIFLLDEPGSYLHSSAQSELLKELQRVSMSNTIIYCTHSQYLLNPSIIKLGSIKIAEKRKSVIELTDYGNYKAKNDRGALSALYQALHMNFANDFLGKLVITEGMTDLYVLEMIKTHTSVFKSDFKIIPGAGSGNSSNLISIGISFSDNFVVLFDNDEGLKALKKYEQQFGEEILRYFHIYSKEKKFRLESFFSDSEKQLIRKISGTHDLKKAFAILYYDFKELQKEVFGNLSLETIERLQPTIKRINAL